MSIETRTKVFDYRVIRLLVGVVALALPVLVTLLSKDQLVSISASYYFEASRDTFVGMLFIVGAFLFAYNGHTDTESRYSKIAALSAVLLALFPTEFPGMERDITAYVHMLSATVLFAVLIYFCFGIFQRDIRGKSGKPGRRSRIYRLCAWVMVAAALGQLYAEFFMTSDMRLATRITYWVELTALWAFGIAWITSGKSIPWLVDAEDAARPVAEILGK